MEENRLASIHDNLMGPSALNEDSLKYYSDKFGNEFKRLIKTNATTLTYPFKKLTKYCDIITSTDGNFRVYSWDTWLGGTMHFFNQIYQYKDNGKVFTKIPEYEEGEASSFFSKIYTVGINNKAYYLTIYNGIYSNKEARQSISIFTIDDDQLDTVKLFRTKTKSLNSIDVSFDFFSVVDRPERPLELITYDKKQKIIYIPLVNENGQVTQKNIQYQLKDGYFYFTGFDTAKQK